MKIKTLKPIGLLATAALLHTSCQKNFQPDLQKLNNQSLNAKATAALASTVNTVVTLDWTKTYQRIDGFGAFGGRITPFFESAKRDSIMDYLFGINNLQLNIVRGKVLHTYPFDKTTGIVTIKPAGVSTDVDVASSQYTQLTDDQKEQLGQVWILKKIKERYQVPVMIASAWTPPLYMKTSPRIDAQWWNGLNYTCCSTDYAKYLAGFAKAYNAEGINFFAISPANEPENIFSTWDASYWTSAHLGEFITNNLRPALNNAGLSSTKIIASENAAWGTANSFLSGMDKSNVDILAGHGYVEITDIIAGNKGLNQNPTPWTFSTGNKPVWVTEASDDSGQYDNTMTGGLKLATNMYKLLAECNANAYVYWLGMLAIRNNEALICTNADGSLEFPKTYDVMGQFSRYVKPGYQRFDAAVQNNNSLKVAAFKDPLSGAFSVVAINSGADTVKCSLQLTGFATTGVNAWQTTSSTASHWSAGTPGTVTQNNTVEVVIPPVSVVTYTGNKQ
ncbi:glycoside hydrolase [Chitinophaga sp. 212800010-3]|uniref:glycoside hydrolase n=1 Tax=unclassified Chitinophaga TaxID=2619133 RepID=UPI002DEDFD6B|nr:Glucuronoxylanase xynC [Chitinophaga sp. 212800010-3]